MSLHLMRARRGFRRLATALGAGLCMVAMSGSALGQRGAVADQPATTDSEDPFSGAGDSAPNEPALKAAAAPTEDVLSKRAEAKIRADLLLPTSMEFTETPLLDAIEYLKDLHDIEIQLDSRALEAAGIGSDTPVTRNLKGGSLASSLRTMLHELELIWIVRDGMLLITTQEAADRMIEVRVYDVVGLASDEQEVRELVNLLGGLLSPKTRSRTAAPSTQVPPPPSQPSPDIAAYHNLLVIRASVVEHDELARVLAEMSAKLAARK